MMLTGNSWSSNLKHSGANAVDHGCKWLSRSKCSLNEKSQLSLNRYAQNVSQPSLSVARFNFGKVQKLSQNGKKNIEKFSLPPL